MKLKNKLFTLIFLSLFSPSLAAQEITMTLSLSLADDFTIKSSQMTGNVVRKNGGYYAKNIKLIGESLESGIDLRDTHIRERLEVQKFPHITLLKGIAKNGKFAGQFKIRKQTGKVAGTLSENSDNLIIEFPIKMSDYQLPPASYMGVGVDDTVQVKVTWPKTKIISQ